MRRSAREFRAECFELEGRSLLALAPAGAAVFGVDPSTGHPIYSLTPLDPKIVASEPTLPPKVVSALATTQGIVVRFNKPMNPIAASNLKNYAVSLATLEDHGHAFFGGLFKTTQLSVAMNAVRLRSAHYDPATQSVTLVPRHRHLNIGSVAAVTRDNSTRASAPAGRRLNVARGLTDLQGNPINADTTPGKVELRLKSRNVQNFRGDTGKGRVTFFPGLR